MENLNYLAEKFKEFSRLFIDGIMSKSDYLQKTIDLGKFLSSQNIELSEFTKLAQ